VSEQAALDRVAELVRRESGLHLPPERLAALSAAIRRTGVDGPDAFLALAARRGSHAAVDRLLDEVTVQETSFYRDPEQLEAIDWREHFTGVVRGGRSTLRVWSVGCATGEEAYTLAMLAAEAFQPGPAPVEVLGTDISSAALARAHEGCYRTVRTRGLPVELHDRYLESEGDRFAVSPALRWLTRFCRHNVVHDPAPPTGETPFDLIVCRNLLIYFEPATAEQVVRSLTGALHPGGALILGAADQLGRSTPHVPTLDGESGGRLAPEERLARVVAAADLGQTAEALAEVDLLLAHDPLNAEAHFLRGLIQLPRDAQTAIDSLRRALLIDPSFALAAFQLGRAYDVLGDARLARDAYERALQTLDPDDTRRPELLRQVDLDDIAAAIRVRIQALL
jgi:chemotaxis protein methyltransferase CheR